MRVLVIIILLAISSPNNCLFAYFSIGPADTSYYRCIKQTVNGRINLQSPYENDEVNPRLLTNVDNALAAGLTVELLFYVNPCWPIDDMISILSTYVKGKNIDRLWVTLNDDKCAWTDFSPEENCQFLQQYIYKVNQIGLSMNILAVAGDWMKAFSNRLACPEISKSSLLWWDRFQQQEQQQQQYKQIGGWESPDLISLTITELCDSMIFVSKVVEKEMI